MILSKFKLLIVVPVVCMIFSCQTGNRSGGSIGRSEKTGWRYNDPKNGGYVRNSGIEQQAGPGLVQVPGGSFVMGQVYEDLYSQWNNIPRQVTVSSFFMDRTEVSNLEYRDYLHWLGKTFSELPEVSKTALPDSLVWRTALGYNEPYVYQYFRHPSFDNYPVVGVSWIQATKYCEWRTDRVNENLLIQKGILSKDPSQSGSENFTTDSYLTGNYDYSVKKGIKDISSDGEERNVTKNDGILLPNYRLPTEAEWEYGALAISTTMVEGQLPGRRIYPWEGASLRKNGQFRAKFNVRRGQYYTVVGNKSNVVRSATTVPVFSYEANEYGLFCMAGNVNEWVLDVFRNMSSQDVVAFNPYRGNKFTKPLINEDGTTVIDSIGRVVYVSVEDSDIGNRENFLAGDNTNFKDGDNQSQSAMSWGGKMPMYYQELNGNKSRANSLISNSTRVYKGGSWKDKPYWLMPSARRYLDEKKSTNDIGFRCAMTKTGV